MTNPTTTSAMTLVPSLEAAWRDMDSSFERFCLTAGIEALEQMLGEDAQRLAGPRHSRGRDAPASAGARRKGKIGFHGGKVDVRRPRLRSYDGHEVELPTWKAAQAEDWLGRWAMNLMLINVSTRKFRRAVRLPEGDVPAAAGDGTSKSAASRRFVALSAERMAEWMASDLSKLDLLVIQIDGLHIGNDLVLVAALGIDGDGNKHPLGIVEGATENAAVVQALIDNSDRSWARSQGLPAVHRRWRQGAHQGDPRDLRPADADPALSDSQGPQRGRAPAQAAARLRAQDAATSLGTRRRRQSRTAVAQSRPPARA